MSATWKVVPMPPESIFQQFPEHHPVLVRLLYERGIQTQEAMDVFLRPDWDRDTHPPSLFRQMPEAVERVFRALESGETITVHGDYDADGVCGSTVLVSTLREITQTLNYESSVIDAYIPHRELEGYGLSIDTVEHLHANQKTSLIITVDCGISNKPAIDRAASYGIDTIVCDHHTMPKELPSAILIHPLVPDETFPNKHLCGTGVAFKLASALIHEARNRGAAFPVGHEKWLLDLVAIATVTDMVPLVGENRVLETFGLVVLNKTKRPGLRALLEVAGAELGSLTTTSIGFVIGPRLNAAGRMSHAHEALALMTEEDPNEAIKHATQLQETNKARQVRSDEMYKEAKRMLPPEIGACILLSNEGWQAGLVGLVAGKLLNEYHVPVFVFGKEGETYVGSGRAPEGVDVMPALHAASEHLAKYGGHPQACGLTIEGDEAFHQATAIMRTQLEETAKQQPIEATLRIDLELPLKEVSWSVMEAIDACKPFGMGNPLPLILIKDGTISAMSTVGTDGKHLRVSLRSQDGGRMNFIGFSFGSHMETLSLGASVEIVCELQINEWNGKRELQGRIVDLRRID